MALSEQKKKTVTILVAISVLLILLGALFFFRLFTPADRFRPNIGPLPIKSQVELNSSEGFNSSILVVAYSNDTLFVLPPGGTGTLPFSVSSTANETFNVSLHVSLGQNAQSYGVHFSVFPSNFTISPGQQTLSVLTVAADIDAPAAFYSLGVGIQTDLEDTGEGAVTVPWLLVADFTPSCIYFLNKPQELNPPVGIPTPEYTPGIPKLSVVPTINLAPGEKTMFLFSCPAQENFSLNATAPAGLSAEFSPAPLDIIFSYTTERKMYALTVTADTNISSGIYKLNMKGSLGSNLFEGSFYVAVK
jgi:hypothetical protein